MIIRLIHNNRIGAYTFMLLLIILFWIKPIIINNALSIESFNSGMPLWKFFSFTTEITWIANLFVIVLAIIINLSLTRINSRYALLSKQSALPGYIFTLIVATLLDVQSFSPMWIAALFFIVALDYLFEAHNYRKKMKECFLAALWISTSSIFSYKLVLIYPLLIILMSTLRLLTFKTLLASLIGLIVPWLFLLGYSLSFGEGIYEYLDYLKLTIDKIYHLYQHQSHTVYLLSTIGFILLIAILSVISAYGTKKIYTRLQYQVFIYSAIYLTGVMLFTGLNVDLLPLLGISYAIIIAHLIDYIRSVVWQNIVISCLFLIAIVGQILS